VVTEAIAIPEALVTEAIAAATPFTVVTSMPSTAVTSVPSTVVTSMPTTAAEVAIACLAETGHYENHRPCQEQRAGKRGCFLKHVVPPSVEPISVEISRLDTSFRSPKIDSIALDAWANGTSLSLGNARLGFLSAVLHSTALNIW
jgi:hypothetical protein